MFDHLYATRTTTESCPKSASGDPLVQELCSSDAHFDAKICQSLALTWLFVVPGVGFEPTRPFGQGGLRLHSHVRRVRFGPPDLHASAVVRPVHLIRLGPARAAESCAGTVQESALRCPTACPTISSWPNDRSDRSHSPLTSPTPSTSQPPQRARRSARGSPRPPPIASDLMPAVRASPSGNASTAPSRPTRSPKGSPERGRCSAVSRHERAPE